MRVQKSESEISSSRAPGVSLWQHCSIYSADQSSGTSRSDSDLIYSAFGKVGAPVVDCAKAACSSVLFLLCTSFACKNNGANVCKTLQRAGQLLFKQGIGMHPYLAPGNRNSPLFVDGVVTADEEGPKGILPRVGMTSKLFPRAYIGGALFMQRH